MTLLAPRKGCAAAPQRGAINGGLGAKAPSKQGRPVRSARWSALLARSLQIAPPGFDTRASFVDGHLFHCKGQNLGRCELLNRNNLGDVAPQQAVVTFIYRPLPRGIGVDEVDLCAPLFRLSEILKFRTVVSDDGFKHISKPFAELGVQYLHSFMYRPAGFGGNPHGDVVACHSTNEGKDDGLLAIASANNRIGLPLTHFGAGINNGRPIALLWRFGCVRTSLYHRENHYGFFYLTPFYSWPILLVSNP